MSHTEAEQPNLKTPNTDNSANNLGVEAKTTSRAHFVRKLAMGVPLLLLGRQVGVPVFEQFDDFDKAGIENDVYFSMEREKFRNLRIGTTFVPSEFGDSQQAMECLRYAVEELGINEIRLPLRWNKTAPKEGEVSLEYYDQFIRYMIDNNVKICPSLGYKAARWPEHHAPEYIEDSPMMLPNGEEVTPEHDLGKRSLEHIRLLAEALKTYDYDFEKMQVENEPLQKFGKKEHTLSPEYLRQGMDEVRRVFPNAKFLVNGGGPNRLPQIVNFFRQLTTDDPLYRGKLVLGYDFYFARPVSPVPLVDKIDPITLDEMWNNDLEKAKIDAKKVGYEVEVTEGQAEEWEDHTYARDSIDAFRYMLLRGMRALDMSSRSYIGLWGIEKMYKKKIGRGPTDVGVWTNDDVERENLIKRINFQRSEELSPIYERIRSLFGLRQR